MAQTVSILLGDKDRKRLGAIASDRSRPLKHIQRANIILHSAERLPVLEVARRAGVSRPAVWRWQQRYAEEGARLPEALATVRHGGLSGVDRQ
ncbi:helix-turn-helix domain-containing protein [Methylocystis echinoides]|uniref:helix-turn-helix domain-containing protein n=1 Tax=Methylocystis echinoides TaxID=29468 RepID=UPI002492D3E6|nr:helix-turn-helix domain-containing protein [Methylocystis echinoides]